VGHRVRGRPVAPLGASHQSASLAVRPSAPPPSVRRCGAQRACGYRWTPRASPPQRDGCRQNGRKGWTPRTVRHVTAGGSAVALPDLDADELATIPLPVLSHNEQLPRGQKRLLPCRGFSAFQRAALVGRQCGDVSLSYRGQDVLLIKMAARRPRRPLPTSTWRCAAAGMADTCSRDGHRLASRQSGRARQDA
jgi:hypothetical protein